ncbi:MAG: O-sialoglycoprotein endopeptidase [Candidatus Berkelbacteria bacterium Licking1014_2]|uniref:tRNA N6-adenosine threonylcarbamoyltransferase n=1 Tax=Candidatus Berkelbacteria bacterium Licking1014_2 TaxID=2017146 RepID=A0A554LX43_9BACT|nr:MAG: O-sialoglycoprotein endopeptidase [Candidatus Berkelbacteria bacterium Licking1014_2]
MRILAIETSCDETSAAVVADGKIISNIVASQIAVHRQTRGVVPEVASRLHAEKIIPVIKKALGGLKMGEIDAIAVTKEPGLPGALLVGLTTARILAWAWEKPLLEINHLYGHIAAALSNLQPSTINFQQLPAVALVVSGGHTSLFCFKKWGDWQLIGETLDDAAGEAFDKIAKILGLPYPGGPSIAAAAMQQTTINKQQSIISFPRPLINSDNFNFSFSGLKTAVLYFVQKLSLAELKKLTPAIAYEAQEAISDVLVAKTLAAAKRYGVKTIILSGGVAANSSLREKFKMKIENCKLKIDFLLPAKNLCTDNAAMIGLAAHLDKLGKLV